MITSKKPKDFVKNELVAYLKNLRDEIIEAFEKLENRENLEPKEFKRECWNHHSGGGGEISLLRGNVFEKAAVNWSGVSGPKFPLQNLESEEQGAYFATGVSLITHMQNPYAPTVHMNIRYIETEKKFWFGGGFDLTPMGFFFEEDQKHFHRIAKDALDPFGKNLYPEFSKNAADYFYIPHRKKERGVGGIFFDHFNTGNFEKDLAMWKTVGSSFLNTILPLYEKRIVHPYGQKDRELQANLRAHYVEFNLLYDRGTKFGFNSGGKTEAILCSLPPTASW